MQTIKHKLWGHGTIINKEAKEIGAYITVRFDASGKESRFSIPESFQTGLIVAEGDLKEEVESSIQAKNEAEQAAREARIALPISDVHTHVRSSATSAWKTIVTGLDRVIMEEYEAYLLQKGYAGITPSGALSTVPQYLKAVNSVLIEEHLTWSTLESQIAEIVTLYGKGGLKESIGNYQHKTTINALKRFQEFVASEPHYK